MRITRQHVPQAPETPPRVTLPTIEGHTFWLGLALLGVAIIVAPPFTSAAVVGAVVLGLGCHRLGMLDAHRGGPAQDPRFGALSRGLAEVQHVLAQILRDDGPAPAPRGDAPRPAGDEPVPLGRARGGGRPGRVGTLPAPDPLDAPLDGEDPRATGGEA